MSNRRQLLLSQLKNNLDIVSRAIGLDKNKASSAEKPAEPARFEPDSSSSIAYNVNKDQDFPDTETRGQAPNRAPPFHTDHYPRHAAPNNGTTGARDDAHEHHRSSYDDQYSTHRERTALFPASAVDIDSEDAFLYGSRLPEPTSRAPASGYPGSNIRQETGDDLMNKINFLLHGGSTTSAKKLPVTSDEMQVDPYAPQISVTSHAYNVEPKRTAYHPSSAASQDSDETVDRILKTIGLDGRINDMVQGLIRKDSQSARSSQALPQLTVAPPMSANSIPNQMPPVAANSGSNQMNWDRATQQFLNKMSYASMGEMPREPEIPFAFQYPPPPNWNNQKDTKLPDSSGGLETRLYFKAKPEGTALPGLSYRQNDSSAGRAMTDTLSNIKALEEALAGLNQSKTSLMLRPPGSQRDSMMLENMRMQEELSGQILTLRDTARDLSQQMKNQTSVASSIPPGSATQQSESLMKNSPNSFASQPTEEPLREPSTSKHSDRISTDRKSRSRSHSRDKKKHRSSRSRSRSRDRRRTRGSRRHSRSRSRDGYRRRTRNRSRSRDRSRSRNRSRSRERRRSRDRMLSDADRKALGFGTSARKALEAKSEAKSVAQKAEDKEKKALEMALSMYVGAAEYYNGTNIWCQKCDVIFSDVFGLCQHLHSEMHQAKVDPDFNKPRPPYAPVIPPGVPSAPSRGYEFVLPLQAFFCSLCCEFSKDINKAEEHVKSAEHNKKFKQFVTDNSGYELKFLKDVMMAIARSKVVAQDDPLPSQPTTDPKPDAAAAGGIVTAADPKKYSNAFLNPEDDSKRETREKFQIKFTGALKQGSTTTKVASKSPDVEIVKVTTSEQARKTSAALAASTANKIVMAKKLPGKTEFSRPSGWVLRADAHSKPPPPSAYPLKNITVSPASLSSPKTPLHNDKPKEPTLDIFSPDSPKTTSTPFSKSTGGRLQTTTVTIPSSGTGSAKKSEEAVLNIGDFEIFDEC